MRPAVHLLGLPERRHPRPALDGDDLHVLVGDAADSPALRAEHEGVAHRAFPHELLVQLADQRARVGGAQAEVPAVGDGAAVGVQAARGAGPGAHGASDGVDGHHRRELPQPGVRVPAREHAEHQVELLPGQVVERQARADRVVQLVHAPRLHAGHRDEHLGQHVQRGDHGRRLLDVAADDAARQHRRVHEVPAVQREEHRPAHRAHTVARPAQPLHGRADGERRAHEHHLVERADVDAQLQRAGGHDGRELAALEAPLHDEAHLARERPVVRPRDHRTRVLVDEPGHLLGVPARVDEEQRGAVAGDDRPALPGEAAPQLVVGPVGAAPGAVRAPRSGPAARPPPGGNRTPISRRLAIGQSITSTRRFRYAAPERPARPRSRPRGRRRPRAAGPSRRGRCAGTRPRA